MTPYEFTLLLHYHTRGGNPDDYIADTDLRRETLEYFVHEGLLEPISPPRRGEYTTTEKARIFIDAALATLMPERRWVMPT